jgi:hypothetical protein
MDFIDGRTMTPITALGPSSRLRREGWGTRQVPRLREAVVARAPHSARDDTRKNAELPARQRACSTRPISHTFENRACTGLPLTARISGSSSLGT